MAYTVTNKLPRIIWTCALLGDICLPINLVCQFHIHYIINKSSTKAFTAQVTDRCRRLLYFTGFSVICVANNMVTHCPLSYWWKVPIEKNFPAHISAICVHVIVSTSWGSVLPGSHGSTTSQYQPSVQLAWNQNSECNSYNCFRSKLEMQVIFLLQNNIDIQLVWKEGTASNNIPQIAMDDRLSYANSLL